MSEQKRSRHTSGSTNMEGSVTNRIVFLGVLGVSAVKSLSPDQNHGSACPCPAILSPFSLLPGIFSPVTPKRVSGHRPTGGRSTRGGCPVLSSPVRLLPCPQTFSA